MDLEGDRAGAVTWPGVLRRFQGAHITALHRQPGGFTTGCREMESFRPPQHEKDPRWG